MQAQKPFDLLDKYPTHDYTLCGVVASRAHVRGSEPFLIFNGTTLSWQSFQKEVDKTVAFLVGNGVVPGQRVGIMANNSINYVVVFFSIIAAGAIAVPLNPDLLDDEASYLIEHAGPVMVFFSQKSEQVLRSACKSMKAKPALINLEALQAIAPGEEGGGQPVPPGADAEETSVIIYTSGTTSRPKGVMHNQKNMVIVGEFSVSRMNLTEADRMLCVLPFFHINALFYSLMGALVAGASLIITDRFSASQFWNIASRHQATQANIIATVGHILIRRPIEEFVPDHCMRKIYGAPIPTEVYTAFRTRFGVPTLIEGYGMTEAPAISSNPFNGPHKIGSIGVPTQHPCSDVAATEMKVIDENNHEVSEGVVGELVVKSPVLMQGYYKDPGATQESFVDGWFRTGDLVRQEADGYYTFIARKKDVIRRRGENISGAEIDTFIAGHPDVQVVASIPVPSELGEEEILVAVQKKTGALLTESELHQWCQENMNPIKVPRFITFVDSFPYTPSHRVAKHQLRNDKGLIERAMAFVEK